MFAFFATWFMQLQEKKKFKDFSRFFKDKLELQLSRTKIYSINGHSLTPLVKLNFFNTPLAKTRQEGMEGFFVKVFKCKS